MWIAHSIMRFIRPEIRSRARCMVYLWALWLKVKVKINDIRAAGIERCFKIMICVVISIHTDRAMSESKYLNMLLSFLLVTVLIMMSSSSTHLGADARYLPTRSDPLAPIGPPRGEDPRFDRLYDVIKEVSLVHSCSVLSRPLLGYKLVMKQVIELNWLNQTRSFTAIKDSVKVHLLISWPVAKVRYRQE